MSLFPKKKKKKWTIPLMYNTIWEKWVWFEEEYQKAKFWLDKRRCWGWRRVTSSTSCW